MSGETIDLLPILQGEQDYGEELPVQVGDTLNLVAETGALWLPSILEKDSFEQLQEWTEEIRGKLRAAGVQTAIISADVFDRDDDHRQLELELQVTYVGDLPVQLDQAGQFYGYDDDGNLLTYEQFHERVLAQEPAEAGTFDIGWKLLAGVALAAVAVAYAVTIVNATVTTVVSPEARQSVHEVSDATKTVAVAAALIGLVYLLSKA